MANTVIDAAGHAGFHQLRLDTLPGMASAQALYRKRGFVEIPPYDANYLPGTRFFSLALK